MELEELYFDKLELICYLATTIAKITRIGMSSSLKVLHLIDTTGPGGAETVFVELVDRIRQQGVESVAVVHGPGWVLDTLNNRGVEVVLVPSSGSFDWRLIIKLRQLIKEHNINVLVTHLLGSNVYGAIVGFLFRVPVIAVFHGMVDVDVNDRFRSLRVKIMNMGVKKIVCVSQALENRLRESQFVTGPAVEVIYNGINTEKYTLAKSSRIKSELHLRDSDYLWGCLGNIRPAKGYEDLIAAAAILIEKCPSIHVAIAGQAKGELYRRLLECCEQLGIEENVHFLGFQQDTPEYLSNLDGFVLPSVSEGFSISTIEAMAAQLPIVSTRCGGPEEILIDGVDGFFVPVGDPVALASKLLEIVESPHQAQHAAYQARKNVVSKFDIATMVDRYVQLCNQVICK